jgi:23S rRNA U2552 (ribose-2'-O)-methylase RlmE/FtsJ
MEGHPSCFLDICGAPGAFTQYLTAVLPPPVKAYGISLETYPAEEKNCAWLSDVTATRGFVRLKGEDGTGNLYTLRNLEHVCSTIGKRGDKVRLAVADGEFEIPRGPLNEHRENLEEIVTSRLFLAETLLALKVLEPGGHFVLKLFDTFTVFSASLVYLIAQLFRECVVVKPGRSRIMSSERYVVFKALNRESAYYDYIVEVVQGLFLACTDDTSPAACCPRDVVFGDATFMEGMRGLALDMCHRETGSLRLVLDSYERKKKGQR